MTVAETARFDEGRLHHQYRPDTNPVAVRRDGRG